MRAKAILPPIAGAILAAVFGTFALTAPACVCTAEPSFSSLMLGVHEAEDAALAPGTWEFAFIADGEAPLHARCEIGPDSRSVVCEDGDIFVFPIIFDDPTNPYTRFQFELTGGDGTDELPSVLGVTITHDGVVVFDEDLEPKYTRSEPARCDPDCFDDSIKLVVDRS